MNKKNKMVIFFSASNLKEKEIKKISAEYKYFIGGFYTVAIKEKNEIKSYKLISFSGEEKILASKDLISPIYINKYSIDLETIDFAISEIENAVKNQKIVLIDEFGSFFLKSEKFLNTIVKLISGENPTLIWARNIKEIRKTFENIDDINIYDIKPSNRAIIREKIEQWLCYQIKNKKKIY